MLPQTCDQRKRVLIVDSSEDSRQVFRTVLQRRGVEILEALEPSEGLTVVRQHHPDVVVLDLESYSGDPESLGAAYHAELAPTGASLVLLGNICRASRSNGMIVRKPYHYGPLIRRIEQLAERSTPTKSPSVGTARATRPSSQTLIKH